MGQEPAGLDEAEYQAETVGIEPLQGMGDGEDTASSDETSAAEDTFSALDKDADSLLDHDEYMMSVRDAFGAYDKDSDGELSQSELTQAGIDRFDADGDGVLSQEEFER